MDPQQEAEHSARLVNGAGLRDKLWDPGQTLMVRFLEGDPILQQRVEEAAQEWTRYANIFLQFGDYPGAQIRITFSRPGSWSYIGKDALKFTDREEPTMNLGFINLQSTDQFLRQTVLHEFGHTLGLIHEQSNPNARISWHREAAYAMLMGPPNYWSKGQVDMNLFFTYDPGDLAIVKDFDPASIMVLPVSSQFTGGQHLLRPNSVLSEMDKETIGRLYPFDSE